MTQNLKSNQVWQEIENQMFAVLGMVTADSEARTVGIVYVVHNHKLYISSQRTAWKVRHIAQNPHVSLTVTIPKRIPFLPWIKIPAATITFSGLAHIYDIQKITPDIQKALFRGLETDPETVKTACVIEVTPEKEFVTYGVGVSLSDMRDPHKARGRAAVAG